MDIEFFVFLVVAFLFSKFHENETKHDKHNFTRVCDNQDLEILAWNITNLLLGAENRSSRPEVFYE